MTLTRNDIAATLRQMGIRAGDLLVCHSSYKSLAPVEDGPAAVAQALIDAVSPGGSAFLPTFNFGQLPFDPATTPSLAGAITEAFRQLPGIIRSLHPTHPVSGIGPAASAILADHDTHDPFGPASPLWRLWQRNAWVLLIGCGHESNSTIHVAEEALQLPYIPRTRVGRVIRDGRTIDVIVRRPGCSDAFNVIEPLLRQRNQILNAHIANSHLRLMRSADLVATAMDMLRADPTALLCNNPTCDACPQARQMLAAAGTI